MPRPRLEDIFPTTSLIGSRNSINEAAFKMKKLFPKKKNPAIETEVENSPGGTLDRIVNAKEEVKYSNFFKLTSIDLCTLRLEGNGRSNKRHSFVGVANTKWK